jgi:hypothetical protein
MEKIIQIDEEKIFRHVKRQREQVEFDGFGGADPRFSNHFEG